MDETVTDPRNFIDENQYPRLQTLRVTAVSSFTRSAPSSDAGAGTELIYGELFHIHRQDGDWVWGQSETQLPWKIYPGYVGWVKKEDLSEIESPSFRVQSFSAPVFKTASFKSSMTMILSLNAVVSGEIVGDYVKTEMGFLHSAHLCHLTAPKFSEDFVTVAERCLGQPYVWGGVRSAGLDCSGLVQTALRATGQDAPRDSDQQALIGWAVDISPDLSNLKRGDLVFWDGHVGIMQDASHMIHANAFHMAVVSENLKEAVLRIKKSAGAITAIRRLNN